MKVLLLTQVLPYPPDSGPKVKTYNLIKYLVRQHDVTLVSFVRGDQSADVAHLERYCQTVHTIPMARSGLRDARAMARSFLNGQPFMMVRDDRADMRRLVDQLVVETRFDVAHADQLNMAQYAARVPGALKLYQSYPAPPAHLNLLRVEGRWPGVAAAVGHCSATSPRTRIWWPGRRPAPSGLRRLHRLPGGAVSQPVWRVRF